MAPKAMRLVLSATLLLLLALAQGACRAPDGSSPPGYPDQHGELQRPLHPEGNQAHVLVFVTTDCPIANGYAPEIQSIADDYRDRSVRFFLVHVDPQVTREAAAAHALDYGFEVPILLDPTQELVAETGATITPEAVVLTPSGEMAYRGRIDNWYAQLGRKRRFPTQHDLRDAIDAVLAGEPVETARTQAVGCFVPDPL